MDPVAAARKQQRRADALAEAGDERKAAAEFGRLIERFATEPDEAVRWLVADAYVQRAELTLRLGDGPGALRIRAAGQQAVGDLIRPAEDVVERELRAAWRRLDADDAEGALEHLRRATCGHTGVDAPSRAIEAAGLAAQASLDAGGSPAAAAARCDAWLAHAGAARDPDRRASFGWLHARKAWAQSMDGDPEAALATIDAGLAYLADDYDEHARAVVEDLEDERARYEPGGGPVEYERALQLLDGDGPLAECEALLRAAADTGLLEAWLVLGYVLEMQPGRLGEARDALETASASERPDVSAPAHLRLGRLHDLDFGDPLQAMEHYDRARRSGGGKTREAAAVAYATLVARFGDRQATEDAIFAWVGPRFDAGDAVGDTRLAVRVSSVFAGLLRRPRIWRAVRHNQARMFLRRRRRDRRDAHRRGSGRMR